MVTFNLTFTDQEAAGLFKKHGLKIEEREFTKHVPVYHNRTKEQPFKCQCVIHPHSGQPIPLGLAFERVFYSRKEQIFVNDVDMLTIMDALKIK